VAEPAKAAPPKKKKKTPGKVLLNYNLCSLCGLCVQSCPVNSLRHSNNVYLASLDKDDYSAMDLLQRLKEQGEKAPPPEEKPKKPKPETPEAPKPAEARAAAEDATTGPQETAGEKAVEAPGEAKADTEPDKQ
jgi:NADH-quinone oxidoreductase subunit I